jgi:hypothetical protein
MVQETILQNWIFTKFFFPFALMFLLVYAIIEKTKIFGDNHQVNALISAVIGFIFVSVVYPKEVVGNLILFLTIALVVIFVGLMIWGFLTGSEAKLPFGNKMKYAAFAIVIIAVILATLWALGFQGSFIDSLFNQSWSGSLWTNVIFVVLVVVMLVVIMYRRNPSG